MNVLTRMRLFALTAILLAPLSACALSGGPIDGKVVEEGTNKPIAGAIVVMRWNGLAFSFADTRTVCVHVLTTTTDEKGNYSFPLWFKESPLKGVHDVHPTITAHHPGYQLVRIQPDTTLHLKPFTGTREEQFKHLWRIFSSTGCYSAGRSARNLYPPYAAVYEESKHMAVTEGEKQKLRLMRQIAATAWIAEDGHMTSRESQKLIDEHLREHLQ